MEELLNITDELETERTILKSMTQKTEKYFVHLLKKIKIEC